jgi:hypothetical protein
VTAALARRLLATTLLGLSACVVYACSEPVIDDEGGQASPNSPSRNSGPKKLDSADASVPDDATPSDPSCQAPAGSKCAVSPQCGCGMTETCDITTEASGSTSCVTGGNATMGRPCNQTGDCVAGLTCRFGACRPYCATPRTSCNVAGTALCVEFLGDGDKPLPGNNVCTIKCDPRNPSAVCGTNACLWFSSYYKPEKVSDCNFAGATDELATCVGDSDCKPGLACMTHPKYGLECEKWCRIGVAGDCPSTSSCVDTLGVDAPTIDGVKEGVCQTKS